MNESSPKPSISAAASAKQIAYLNYMGCTAKSGLSADEAQAAIARLDNASDYEQWRQLLEKKTEWQTDRFLLHPSLFSTELKIYLEKDLPAILSSYVRGNLPEAAHLLTPAGVRGTMQSLAEQNPAWWRSPQRQHLFLTELVLKNPDLHQGQRSTFVRLVREKLVPVYEMVGSWTTSLVDLWKSKGSRKAS